MTEVSDIYLSETLRVRLVVPANDDGRACIVSFGSFTDYEPFDRPGFGEGYFASRGIAAIHAIPRENRWYQEPDLPEALAAMRAVASRYGRVVAYGSSMGGFAAIRYGAAAGADVALAISPQFSIDPREAPFERRWRAHSRSIRFVHPLADLPKVGHVYLFYDPRNLDGRHARLIAETYPTSHVRLPYAGHPVGSFLNETGLLSGAVADVIADRFNAQSCQRAARRERRRSGQYLFSLGHRVGRHHVATKLGLCRMAVAATPGDPAYESYLAVILEFGGLAEEAESHHRAALAREPDQPTYLERYARALLRQGRIEPAVAVAQKAYRLAPGISRVVRIHALTLLATGRHLPGLALLLRVALADRRAIPAVLGEIAAIYRWRRAVRPDRPGPGRPPTPVRLPFRRTEITARRERVT